MLRQVISETRPNTVEICMTGPLSNSLVTGKEIDFEKVSLIVMSNLVNTLAADEIHPVLNRDNLRIPIQIQLSEKEQKFF